MEKMRREKGSPLKSAMAQKAAQQAYSSGGSNTPA
jgi:hypothetical protein